LGNGLFKVELETFGNDVLIRFQARHFTQSITNRLTYFDILVDGEYYLSSLTATPLTDGIYNFQYNVTQPRMAYIEALVTDLEAGIHTFEPYFKTSNADSAALVGLACPLIMMAEEYCLTP
jgi:hypothetical protein